MLVALVIGGAVLASAALSRDVPSVAAKPTPRATFAALEVPLDKLPSPCAKHDGLAAKTLSDDHAAWLCGDGFVFHVSLRHLRGNR
jgi:hypothetical protein